MVGVMIFTIGNLLSIQLQYAKLVNFEEESVNAQSTTRQYSAFYFLSCKGPNDPLGLNLGGKHLFLRVTHFKF